MLLLAETKLVVTDPSFDFMISLLRERGMIRECTVSSEAMGMTYSSSFWSLAVHGKHGFQLRLHDRTLYPADLKASRTV